MDTDDRKRPDLLDEDPAHAAASLQPDCQIPAATDLGQPLDLSLVPIQPKQVVSARIGIRYDGYVGTASTLAASTVIECASQRVLKNPLPTALEMHPGAVDERVLRGVPKDEYSKAWLNLDWYDHGRYFRANFRRLLTLLKIKIPKGTRMVINLAVDQDERLGPCIKLWWDSHCFVPIDSPEED